LITDKEKNDYFQGIKYALALGGYLILCEPVSETPEYIGSIPKECLEQREREIETLINKYHFSIVSQGYQDPPSILNSVLKVWVLQAKDHQDD
jgi:hypothetical protein